VIPGILTVSTYHAQFQTRYLRSALATAGIGVDAPEHGLAAITEPRVPPVMPSA
jgi:hypothetical protein